jgi:hypothetical protein
MVYLLLLVIKELEIPDFDMMEDNITYIRGIRMCEKYVPI